MESEKDKLLWKEARKRVGFKNHLITYLILNIFFWMLWYFTDYKNSEEGRHGIPWPTFCTLGWGFGLFWHFAGVYLMGNKASQVEKEYQKLKRKQEGN